MFNGGEFVVDVSKILELHSGSPVRSWQDLRQGAVLDSATRALAGVWVGFAPNMVSDVKGSLGMFCAQRAC